MRILKQNPILRLVNSYIVDSPQPTNISYLWNFGSLLALCLGLQIVTGIFLVMHYTPHTDLAFNSVEHIMRDVDYGWALRYTHANVASFFFIFVYAHMARGLYYNSYKSPRVAPWTIGVIILVLMIATAFLGYCLVYGQMSLWGATVITNLLSAIPWIGKDFVEFEFLNFFTNETFFYLVIFFSLTTIGIINIRALRGQKIASDKKYAENIPYAFMAMFAGLVDGDGYISITNASGYIRLQLIIALHIRDVEMLNHIQSVLRVGRVNIYPASKTAKLTISKTDLQEIIFPLLSYHNIFFLTNTRISQFELAMYILETNIILFSEIPAVSLVTQKIFLPTTALEYYQLPFFFNWLVGFTIGEGSFIEKTNGEFNFSLVQRSHPLLFAAFQLVFNSTRQIEERSGISRFVVSSKKDIQSVVNFFSFSNLHPLLGYKLIQYNNWVNGLKNSLRYADLKLPE